MTPRQFEIEFQTACSYIDEIKDIRIKSIDVNYFLNESLHIYVNKKLNSLKDNIEKKQKDIDDIRTLFVKNTVLIEDRNLRTDNQRFYNLPEDYLFLLSDYSKITFCNITKIYPNRLSRYEDLRFKINYTFTKTKYNSPLSQILENKICVFIDNFDIDDLIIDYIKNYDVIDVINDINTNLPENTHKEIISIAVNLFLENKNQNRFKSSVEKNIILK